MKFGSVDYFKDEILKEESREDQKKSVIAYTDAIVSSEYDTEEMKIERLKNLIEAWKQVRRM